MKSIQTVLTDFYTGLNTIKGVEVYHYEAAEDYALPYIVWAEEGEDDSFSANNKKEEQTIQGSVDFFTQTEFDPIVDDIQDVLNELGGFYLEAVQFEENTKLIHYTWKWSLT